MQDRVALLVGLQRYPNIGELRTPSQDVRALKRALERCGFQVDIVDGALGPITASQLRTSVARFAQQIDGLPYDSDTACALVYVAGHGVIRADRQSVILTDDATMDETGIAGASLPIQELLEALAINLSVPKIVMIDTCQSVNQSRAVRVSNMNFPFLTGNMSVTWSTAVGELAIDGQEHSPFAAGLLASLKVPDLSIEQVIREVRAYVVAETNGRQSPLPLGTTWRPIALNPSSFAPVGTDPQHLPANPAPVTTPGPRRHYSDDEIRQSGHLIHKLKAKDTSGRWAYFFVLVEPAFEVGFLRDIEGNGTLDLEHYGLVIASCYGEQPDDEVLEFLRARYGFDLSAGAPQQTRADPPMMIAMRRSLGFGKWSHIVAIIPPEQRMAFAVAADYFTDLDRAGLGVDGKGFIGALRGAIDRVGVSLFDIEELAKFGHVIYRGDGAKIPGTVEQKVSDMYGVAFDWERWEVDNLVIQNMALNPS